MDDSKVIDLGAFLKDKDPGDETGTEGFDAAMAGDPTYEASPLDEETIEVSIEEILGGFAQGLELLRLGILSVDARLTALEESLGYAQEELDIPDMEIEGVSVDELADAELAE